MSKKNIEQPDLEQQKEEQAIVTDQPEEYTLGGKTHKLGYIKNGTEVALTNVVLNEKDETKVVVKCAALIMLNSWYKIKLWYWFLWRWLYYVKQYSYEEYIPLVALAKKKIQLQPYCLVTMLLTGMKTTIMSMTREEVERTRQELYTVQHGQLEKSTNGSQNQSVSSSD